MKRVVVNASNRPDLVLNTGLERLREAMDEIAADQFFKKSRQGKDFGYYCGYIDAAYLNIGVVGKDLYPSMETYDSEAKAGYLEGRADAVGDIRSALDWVIEGWDYTS